MIQDWLGRILNIKLAEQVSVVLAVCFFFVLLFGYFMLRPLRETMGLRGGVDSVRWLFIGTVAAMVVANVVYGLIASRLKRSVLVPAVYGAAVASLGVFLLLLLTVPEENRDWVGKVFYVWLSVFNLFAVSVFWQLMADVFTLEQSKRLFGLIGVGGTAGAIMGSSYAWVLAGVLGPVGLMATAGVLISIAGGLSAAMCWRASPKPDRVPDSEESDSAPLGGTAWAGLARLFSTRYLGGIGLMVMLFSIGSTLLYFEKLRIVEAVVTDDNDRTSLFAAIELAGQSLTILLQVLLTGRLMRWLGVGIMLAFVPIITIVGFSALGVAPSLGVIAVFEASRRAGNFAMTKPARETLFTVVPREDKYKAKAGIDTFVYRGGDTLGTFIDRGIALIGIPIVAVAVPLGILGTGLALWLGREEQRRGLSRR